MNITQEFKNAICFIVAISTSYAIAFAQQTATTIYGSYNSFFKSSSQSPISFNRSNHLLAFEVNGTTYSTGIDDSKLDNHSVTYTSAIFTNFTIPSNLKYKSSDVGVASHWGGKLQNGAKTDYIKQFEPLGYNKLIEAGSNGLELGTCVFKIDNQDMVYSIGNIAVDNIDDATPDIIIAETGQPTGKDWFSLRDKKGNVVGKTIRYSFNKKEKVGVTDWTVYKTNNQHYTMKKPKQISEDLRLLTFEFSDFGLERQDADKVVSFVRNSSGHASNVFTAYNQSSINAEDIQVLPVEMTRFEGAMNETEIELDWTTASEINNDYFTIERSTDGINFEPIGDEAGAGSTTEEQSYSFVDTEPVVGVNYYRIKQTDYDGSFTYSEVVMVKMTTVNTKITIFPNPFVDHINIQAEDEEARNVSVYDVTGKLVSEMTFTANTTLDFHRLPAGTYALRIEKENGRGESQLIVKQ